MDALSLIVVATEIVAGVGATIMHLRKPFTGPPLRIYQASMVLAALSLASMAASIMIVEPESRGFFAVMAVLIAVGVIVLRSKSGGARIGPLASDTEAAEKPGISGYTVRTAPRRQPQPVAQPAVQPAHSNVRAARSARVRRIMAMEE